MHGGQAAGRRHRLVHHFREGRRRRRHLARQHLSRSHLRRPFALLLLLVPAQPELVAPAAAGSRDTGVLPAGGRGTGHSSAHPVRHQRHQRPVRRREVAAHHRRRRGDFRRPRHRHGGPAGTSLSGDPRAGHVRRPRLSFVALGSLGLFAGQADRFDRHRLDRCADHRGARRQGAAAEGLSAHRAVGLPDA